MTALAAASDKLARSNLWWWKLETQPICPTCNRVCLVYSSRQSRRGVRVQYRKCPKCGYRTKSFLEP